MRSSDAHKTAFKQTKEETEKKLCSCKKTKEKRLCTQLLPNVGVPKILPTGNSPFSDAFLRAVAIRMQ